MSNFFQEHIDRQTARQQSDAARFKALDGDACQLCGAYGTDKRNLIISCFYAVHEVVPEAINLQQVDGPLQGRGYYLRICKSCRARFLDMLAAWRAACIALRGREKDHDGDLIDGPDDGADIPIREHGTTRWVTRAEWEAQQRDSPA